MTTDSTPNVPDRPDPDLAALEAEFDPSLTDEFVDDPMARLVRNLVRMAENLPALLMSPSAAIAQLSLLTGSCHHLGDAMFNVGTELGLRDEIMAAVTLVTEQFDKAELVTVTTKGKRGDEVGEFDYEIVTRLHPAGFDGC